MLLGLCVINQVICPECGFEMEQIQCAPCYDCGSLPEELTHFHEKEHEYNWYEVFGQEVILCDFCDVDFGSYNPSHFSLSRTISYSRDLKFLALVKEPKIEPDFHCDVCRHRLKFINFRVAANEYNQNAT